MRPLDFIDHIGQFSFDEILVSELCFVTPKHNLYRSWSRNSMCTLKIPEVVDRFLARFQTTPLCKGENRVLPHAMLSFFKPFF